MASPRNAGVLERSSSNPMLTRGAFAEQQQRGPVSTSTSTSISDTWAAVAATFVVFAAAFPAGWWIADRAPAVPFIAALVALGVALFTVFKPTSAAITAPLYAVIEGVFVGGISRFYENAYDGIVLQAGLLTASIYAGMWFMFASGRLRLTPKMQKVIITATFGVFAVYMLNLLLRVFGAEVPFLHDSGPLGIGISVVIIGVAALNLLIDFDYIERLNSQPHERWQDWFAAFGLLVTVVWIYLEILRLLAKIYGRD